MIRVLYVDGETDFLRDSRTFLEMYGDFSVTTSESAKKAFSILEEDLPDVVVSEYRVPEMNGGRFLQEVRSRFPGIPFIFFTKSEDDRDVITALNNGADFFLKKQGNPETRFFELAFLIRQAVSLHHAEKVLQEKGGPGPADPKNPAPCPGIPAPALTTGPDPGIIPKAAPAIPPDRGFPDDFMVAAQRLAHVGSWTYSVPDGRMTWTEETFRTLGRDPAAGVPAFEDVVGLIHPDDRADFTFTMNEALTCGIPYEKEWRIIWPGGEEKVIRAQAEVISTEGTVNGLWGTVQDISDQKQVEALLRESEDRFWNQYENSPLAIFTWQKKGDDFVLVSCNRRAMVLTRGRGAALTGSLLSKLYASRPSEVADFLRIYYEKKRVIRDIQSENFFPGRLVRSTGSFVPPDMVLVYYEDITEQAAAEDALRTSEERYRLAMNHLPGTAWAVDTDLVFTLSQGSGLAQIGLEPDEVVGRTLYEVFKTRDPSHPVIHHHMQALKGMSCMYDFPFGDFTFRSTLSPLTDPEGQISGVSGLAVDITELVRVEQKLEESETNFRTFFETITDMIFVAATDGRILFANPAVRKNLGYSDEELFRRNVSDLHPAEHREEARKIFSLMIRKDQDSCPLPLVSRDGQIIPVDTRVWTGTWNGRDCIFGASKDLTAEQEAKQRFERLFRSHPSMMVLSSMPDGVFFDVNDAFCTICGYTRKEVAGKTVADLGFFPDPGTPAALRRTVDEQGHIPKTEIEYRCRDGSIRAGELSGERITSQGKEYFLSVIVDITERKELEFELTLHEKELVRYANELALDISRRSRTEALLREKSEELDRYFTSSLDLLCIIGNDGRFIKVNPEWEKVLGVSATEIVGKNLMDYIHPDDLPGTREDLFGSSGAKLDGGLENRCRNHDGSYRWIEWRWYPYSDVLYTSARDITARRNAEDALRHANRQLNLLNSITRHDITNMVVVIRSYLELLDRKIVGETEKSYIKKMTMAVREIQARIEFSKVFQNLGTREPLWQELQNLLPAREGHHEVSFTADCPFIELFGDPMLKNVFYTLYDNSLRHGGELSAIHVTTRQEGYDVLVVWEDNGTGVPVDQKGLIFERGFGKNTGLGLFLAREILSLTGISIQETGEPGQGARFEIRIPAGGWRFTASTDPD